MKIELDWVDLKKHGCPDEEGIYLCKFNNGDLETFEYMAGDDKDSPYWKSEGRLYVTWWAEIPAEADPEYAGKLECKWCKEISLGYKSVSDHRPFIETWECDCGHVECFHVAEPRTSLYVESVPNHRRTDDKLTQLAFYQGVREGIKMTKEES